MRLSTPAFTGDAMATKKRAGGKKKSSGQKYSRSATKDIESAVRRRKRGTLRSGPGGKGGKVKSRKQAIAIGISEARAKGKKVPRKRSGSTRAGSKRGGSKGGRKRRG
jgi:hypothetical protein